MIFKDKKMEAKKIFHDVFQNIEVGIGEVSKLLVFPKDSYGIGKKRDILSRSMIIKVELEYILFQLYI